MPYPVAAVRQQNPVQVVGAAFVGVLDQLATPAAHAYLLFRGTVDYTGNLALLRRSSDDDEMGFSYVSDADEDLDVSAVSTWLGGATPYIVTQYDQIAGDDITQMSSGNQPELTLSDADFNNKPVMSADGGDYLRGDYTVGGSITQPLTFYSVAKLAASAVNDNVTRFLFDGDSTNRLYVYKGGAPNPDEWGLGAGATFPTNGAADSNVNILTALFNNGGSSYLWKNGVVQVGPSTLATNSVDGLTLGAQRTTGDKWLGKIIGAIVVDGNSSNADKNILGQKLDGKYGPTYMDIT